MPRASADEDDRWFAIDLANTVACPSCQGPDPLASYVGARKWIERKRPELRHRLRPDELALLRRFRSDVRQLLSVAVEGTTPSRAAMDAINRAVRAPRPHPELRWSRRGWRAEYRGGTTAVYRQITSLAARSLIDLLSEAPRSCVRRCEGPGCVHFLVDPTKQQRWCSPSGCGNRVRVQRHYRKLRSS